jgi:hypothetical protein
MAKKISVAPVAFGRRKPSRGRVSKPDDAGKRLRIVTPITPRAVREQMLAILRDRDSDIRHEMIAHRLTPLDRFLSDEEADALETYATDEENFEKMNIGAFGGIRVQTSGLSSAEPSDWRLAHLAKHQRIRRALRSDQLYGLSLWCKQMQRAHDAPSFAEAARRMMLIPQMPSAAGRSNRRDEDLLTRRWFDYLKRIAAHLCTLY